MSGRSNEMGDEFGDEDVSETGGVRTPQRINVRLY